MQFKACLSKEWKYYFRSFKFFGVVIVAFGLVISSILMYYLVANMSEVMPELAGGAGSDAEYLDEMLKSMEGIYNRSTIYTTVMSQNATMLPIIIALILMGAAGKEQKEKAHIIPNTCGLRAENYVLAKMVIYPITVFIITFLATYLSGIMSISMFEQGLPLLGTYTGEITKSHILISSISVGVYNWFIILIFFVLGLIIERPGISVLIIFSGSIIFSSLFTGFGLEKYQPFSLITFSTAPWMYDDKERFTMIFAMTLAITAVIALVSVLINIFVLRARKFKNFEDRPEF